MTSAVENIYFLNLEKKLKKLNKIKQLEKDVATMKKQIEEMNMNHKKQIEDLWAKLTNANYSQR